MSAKKQKASKRQNGKRQASKKQEGLVKKKKHSGIAD